jgi:hypothetical protein
LADVYTKVQELASDCNYVIEMYGDEGVTQGRRARRLMDYMDKWDSVFGDGFFVRQVEKQIKKVRRT